MKEKKNYIISTTAVIVCFRLMILFALIIKAMISRLENNNRPNKTSPHCDRSKYIRKNISDTKYLQ